MLTDIREIWHQYKRVKSKLEEQEAEAQRTKMLLRSANAVALSKQQSPPRSGKGGDRTVKSNKQPEKSPKLPPITLKKQSGVQQRVLTKGKRESLKNLIVPSPSRDETPDHLSSKTPNSITTHAFNSSILSKLGSSKTPTNATLNLQSMQTIIQQQLNELPLFTQLSTSSPDSDSLLQHF